MKKLLLVALVIFTLGSFGLAQGIGFHGVAPQVALLVPGEDGLTTGFAFGAKVNLGEVAPGISIYPLAFYHMPGTDYDDLTFSDIQIGADVHYNLPSVAGVYVGGGLTFNILTIELDYTNPFTGQTDTYDESENRIGFSLLGGYKFPLGGMDAMVEAKYGIVSDYSHLMIGLAVMFGAK